MADCYFSKAIFQQTKRKNELYFTNLFVLRLVFIVAKVFFVRQE